MGHTLAYCYLVDKKVPFFTESSTPSYQAYYSADLFSDIEQLDE